jgi:hypothetical protein
VHDDSGSNVPTLCLRSVSKFFTAHKPFMQELCNDVQRWNYIYSVHNDDSGSYVHKMYCRSVSKFSLALKRFMQELRNDVRQWN